MKKVCFAIIMLAVCLTVSAQEEQKFSPEKFNQELQQFITNEAKLTQQEATKFFPVYREMQNKQRPLFDRQRRLVREQPQDEASALKLIRESDEIDIEMKRIQQTYHERFLEMLPASKVYNIIKAEDKFYRTAFRRFNYGNNRMPGNNRQQPMRPRGNQK
jgi:hypothetical protein